MISSFLMNDRFWRVYFVEADSPCLIDRTGTIRLATTDPKTNCVYLSNTLEGDLLNTVVIHELGHCVIISYNLLQNIHKVVYPEYWFVAEEWICNFIADYGYKIFKIAYDILGDEAWILVSKELQRLVA